MGALVFVTAELSPFTPGGIGRVLHNMLKSMTPEDRARSCVLALDCNIGQEEFSAIFPDARLIPVDSSDEGGRYAAAGHHPPRWAFSDTDLHWKSSVVLRALRSLSASVDIEYVEFPDWGALGFATIQEKKISGLLGNAALAVRLHSAHAILLHHEAHAVRQSDLATVDLERKALRDCDLIIAQLPGAADSMRQVFGFRQDEWEPRLVVHVPPVLLDALASRDQTIAASADMPILFGSKIQRIKRPDLFIRGVSAFCRHNPSYTGHALISAHSFDQTYQTRVDALIAPDLKARFRLDAPRNGVAREGLIGASTFVLPGDFESFCLAAYEASLLGARLILNGANPAFGEGTPWRHGVNCLKFDGTAAGLRRALERNFEDGCKLAPVTLPSHPWPWTTRQSRPPGAPRLTAKPLVSVIVPHFNLGAYLPATLKSVLEQTYENIEVIVVDDGSHDPQSLSLLDDLRSRNNNRLRVISASGNIGLSGARNVGIGDAAGEYIVPVDADDLLDRRFIDVAVQALQRNPEFDVFVTPAAYFRDGESPVLPGESADFPDYAIFYGEALVSGVRENRFSTATAVFRADIIRKYGYIESLTSYEDWNLYLRLAHDGRRFLIANDIYFHYRNRAGSMVKDADDPFRHALLQHDNLRTAVKPDRSLPLSYLAYLNPSTVTAAPNFDASSTAPAPNPEPGRTAPTPITDSRDVLLDMVGASLAKRLDRKMGRSILYRLGALGRPRALVSQLRAQFDIGHHMRVIGSSDFFDGEWYLKNYPDVAACGADPLVHYIRYGVAEGRDPGPFFSSTAYLEANPDVKAAGANPLFHYLVFGFKERRRTRP